MAKKKSGLTARVSFRTSPQLRAEFDRFCDAAKLDPSDAGREVLEWLLAAGAIAAAARFRRGPLFESAADAGADLARQRVLETVERHVAELQALQSDLQGKRGAAG